MEIDFTEKLRRATLGIYPFGNRVRRDSYLPAIPGRSKDLYCKQCKEMYVPRRRKTDVRFCSKKCRMTWHNAHRKNL